uniref:Uncharacterized protein n=1 Tax=Arundo donax TaxID=35708 RepID=A0A0A8XRX9_ARUDO
MCKLQRDFLSYLLLYIFYETRKIGAALPHPR